jgi:hypothetical protein
VKPLLTALVLWAGFVFILAMSRLAMDLYLLVPTHLVADVAVISFAVGAAGIMCLACIVLYEGQDDDPYDI